MKLYSFSSDMSDALLFYAIVDALDEFGYLCAIPFFAGSLLLVTCTIYFMFLTVSCSISGLPYQLFLPSCQTTDFVIHTSVLIRIYRTCVNA